MTTPPWARARIHRLQREMHAGPRPDVIEAITRLGLGYRLLTPWTSLVAVDSSVSNPYGPAAQMTVPVEIPEDVAYEGIFGYGRADRKLKIKGMSVPTMASPAPLQEYNAAEKGSRRERSAGGQTSAASGKMPGEPVMADKDEAASQDGREIFRRLILSLDDGTELVLEADGELWHRVTGRRILTTVLTLDQLAQVECLLLQGGLKESAAGNQASPHQASPGQGFHVETQAGVTWLVRDASPALRRLATMLTGLAAV